MKKSRLFTLVIFSLAFLLPILGMLNCSGWNEGTGHVENCLIDAPFLRAYADFYYSFIVISAFVGFLPVGLYILVIVLITKFIAKRLN
jgi:hypothetical protein